MVKGDAITIGFLLFALVVCLIGAWDGLKRQTVRIVVDVIDLHIYLKSLPALLVGIVCTLGIVTICMIGIHWFIWTGNSCQWAASCVLQTTVVAPFTDWVSIICLAMSVGILILWLPTAFSQPRPYRRFLLAPGVWYKEEEVIALINEQLARFQQRSINEDTLLQIAGWVRSRLQLQRFNAHDGSKGGPGTTIMVNILVDEINGHNRSWRRLSADKATLRVIVKAVIEYYLNTKAEANRVWPWREKLLG